MVAQLQSDRVPSIPMTTYYVSARNCDHDSARIRPIFRERMMAESTLDNSV